MSLGFANAPVFYQPTPIYSSGSTPTTNLVPSVFPIAIAGRPYILDDALAAQGLWGWESIPLLREQFDASDTPGEASVNPAGYWRRAQEDWKLGIGQQHFDRPESLPDRYHSSKNLDPFSQEWELSLHQTPDQFDATAYAETDRMVAAGDYLYAVHGTKLRRSPNEATTPTDWHDFGTTVTGLTSDGYWVYAVAGNDVFRFARDAAGPGTVWSTGQQYDLIGTAKDRVFAAAKELLFEINSSGTATQLYTGPSGDFRYTGITDLEGYIWFSAGAGDKWKLYSIDVLDDGTGVAPPQVAAELPDGETIASIQGYLNFLFIGVDRGVRLAIPNRDGDLTVGALIDIGSQVESFEGQGNIVAFEWEQFDTSSSGVGFLDLTSFTDPDGLVLAYAPGYMVDGALHINSIVRRLDTLYFLTDTQGLVKIDDASLYAPSGYFESGWINWNLPAEDKQLVWIRLDTNGLGTYRIELRVNDGPYKEIAVVGEKRNRIAVEERGIRFEYRITALQDNGDLPIIFGVGLESYVAADTTAYINVPVLLAENVRYNNLESGYNLHAEWLFLKNLRDERVLTSYQEGPYAWNVIVEDYQWIPDSAGDIGEGRGVWRGTMALKMKMVNAQLGTGGVGQQ